jgi:wyosine [tRNA(Phe)-imidazoG37] synthetase (radical SAM superfamily)
VTGTPAEVGKIAAIARRVAPCRIQLNTVTRPPAEAFAQPVRVSELLDLATLFDGDVDVVCDISQGRIPAGVLSPDTEEDILALIGRRPCTAADVAGGLDLPLPEVLKYLDRLVNAGSLEPRQMGERCYYTVKGRAPAEAAPESGH